MSFKYFLILILLFISISCTHNDNNGWQRQNINIKLHELFPYADSIKLLNAQEAAIDISDSMQLPTPIYKAFVKEKYAINYDYIFYFYEINLKDSMFTNLFKQITIHDLKTGFGTKKAEYMVTFPPFDSTDANKTMVSAVSLINNRDSVYLLNKKKQIIKIFEFTNHQQK